MSGSSTSAGVFTTDTEFVVTSWDAWLSDVTGLAEEAASGRSVSDLFPELATRGLLARLQRVASAGTVEVIAPAFHEYFFASPPRVPSVYFEHMQQHATISPLRAGDAIVGISVAIQDVTARCEHERDLAAQLRSDDEAVRMRAVRGLANEGEAGTASLATALADQSWRVRRAALEGLATPRDTSAAEALIATVRDRHRDPGALNAALTALAHSQADVLPGVVELLDSVQSGSEIRTYAALALGLIGSRAAVPALLRHLGDANSNVRFHVIEALGRVGARETAHALADVAESRDFTVAFAALDALALIGEPSVSDRIVPLLKDELLQTAAADALARTGSVDVAGPLIALLGHTDRSLPETAGAIATLYARLDEDRAGRDLVAEIARSALTPDVEQAIVAALPGAGAAEAEGLALLLGWCRDEAADRGLASLLERPGMQRAAANILASRGTHAAGTLIAALASDQDDTRKAAAAALGQIGSSVAVVPLAELLDGPAEVAIVAAGALGSIGDPDAFEPLVQQLGHPQPAVRQAIVGALSSLAHPAMPARVRELLESSSPHVRESAAKIAGYFGYADCLDQMLLLCTDNDENVRRVVLEQLPNFEGARASAAVTTALATGSASIRAAAVRGLARTSEGVALSHLVAACGDPDPWVRYYAARSLNRSGAIAAAPALSTLAISDQVLPVRLAAIEALGALGGSAATSTLASLAADRDSSIAAAALTALAGVKGEQVLPTLLAALQTDERERHEAALVALGRRGDAAAAPAVARIAQAGTDPALRDLAVQVLGKIGTDAGIAALVELTADPRRSAAAIAVLACVTDAQVASLGAGLGHPDVEVRCAVADALARTGNRLAIRFLALALDDAHASVRSAAASALQRIDVRDTRVQRTTTAADADPTMRDTYTRAGTH